MCVCVQFWDRQFPNSHPFFDLSLASKLFSRNPTVMVMVMVMMMMKMMKTFLRKFSPKSGEWRSFNAIRVQTSSLLLIIKTMIKSAGVVLLFHIQQVWEM